MNWDAIGAIGQVLGSIAVFVTLGYLAVQVKHTKAEVRRSVSQGRSEGVRDLLARQGEAQELRPFLKANAALGSQPSAFESALMEQAGLTGEEARRVYLMSIAWWNYRLQIIPYVDELPDIERAAFDLGVRGSYGSPGVGSLFYETNIKVTQHPDAVRYVYNVLAQPG